MIRWLAQTAAVTWLNLKNLPVRWGSSLVAVVGIAGVVAILVGVLSIAEGFRQTLVESGSREVALVMRSGTDTELNSSLSRDEVRIIADAPGVARKEGEPIASSELFVMVDLPKRSTGTSANVPMRGVEPAAFTVRETIKIVEGRFFEPGKRELIVGAGAARIFAGADLGTTLRWGETEWTVVGIFSAEGSIAESEIWCDVRVLLPAYRRTMYQSVYARLTSPEAFDEFKDALTADPRLSVKVIRETDYYAEQSDQLYTMIRVIVGVVALLMGAAAAFGAFNTMYTAVAARNREIATLRALGFARTPVVFSVLAEAMLLGAVGGLFGGVLAYLLANGYQTSTINFQSFSQVTFAFRVSPELLGRGIAYALGIGLFGGLLPAWRAARLPVATALREM